MTVPNLSFRPMQKKDLPFSFNVYASTRREEMAISGWPDQEIEDFLISQGTAQHTFYNENYTGAEYDIICLAGEDIGRLYVHWAREEVRVMDIALLPPYLGRGIGTEIIQDLITRATEKGLSPTLHVEQNNPARNLFKRLGFVFVEARGIYHFMKYPLG